MAAREAPYLPGPSWSRSPPPPAKILMKWSINPSSSLLLKLTFISFQKQSALFPLSQHSQRLTSVSLIQRCTHVRPDSILQEVGLCAITTPRTCHDGMAVCSWRPMIEWNPVWCKIFMRFLQFVCMSITHEQQGHVEVAWTQVQTGVTDDAVWLSSIQVRHDYTKWNGT